VVRWLESLLADVRHGARVLRRRPILASTAIGILSLGIGANAAIFSLLNALLLKPLPYGNPGRLVAIVDRAPRVTANEAPPTIPEILDAQERSRTVAAIGFFDTRDFSLTGLDEPTRVVAARVSASLFDVLGATPAWGRVFADAENRPGNWNVIVLSDGLWRRLFGADPSVVGRVLNLNGNPYTVVGVLPRHFSLNYPGLTDGEPIDLYVPFTLYAAYTSRTAEFVNVRRVTTIARLNDRSTLEAADADLGRIGRELAQEHPDLYRAAGEDLGFHMGVVGLRDLVSRPVRQPLTLLLGAVAVVLLIACVNAGQFMLAQSLDREVEVLIRAALGAGRARVFRQFVLESLLLAVAGGALGLLQALWLVQLLVALIPGHRPELASVSIDPTVVIFTVAVSLLSALVAGVVPAMYFSQIRWTRNLGARNFAGVHHRGRHVLVAIEVAFAVVLLTSAGLLIQGLRRLQHVDRGFSFDNVVVMQVRGTGTPPTQPIASVVYQHYLDHIAAMPGVEAAATAAPLPFRNPPTTAFVVEADPSDITQSLRRLASYQIVSPNYFDVFRIPLRDGRVFSVDDRVGRSRVAIVSETLAREQWPRGSALGQRVRVGANTLTIVGVVADVQTGPLESRHGRQIYVSNLQQFEPNMNIAVRLAARSAITERAIKMAIWKVAPNQPVFNIQPMAALVRGSLAEQRFIVTLLGAFAALALLMSAAGVYTVIAHVTARRTHEIAVRLAVGARVRDIVRVVSVQTFRWTIAGLAVGLALTLSLGRLTWQSLRVGAHVDPLLLAALSAMYLVVAGLAMFVPVARILWSLDPAAALRTD
jgi:predicted permease